MRRQINILEYLDNIVEQKPDKIAFGDEVETYSFQRVFRECESVGTALAKEGVYKEPVVVYMQKRSRAIVAFYGVVAAGCYYVPLDDELPDYRVELIFSQLTSKVVICDEVTAPLLEKMGYQGKALLYDDICQTTPDKELLADIRSRAIDTDPIYIVFTSGSTGVPKGVVACHRSVIDYIENLSEVLRIDENTVFGNQAPLYVDACLKELYPTLKFGATTWLIPREMFLQPIKMIEYLNEKQINTICWVVPALTYISGLGTLGKHKPEYLRTIAFGSEVFPAKQFRIWQQTLPETRFINLYGPTEATGMSCYYEVDHELQEDEVIPIGKPFDNTEIMLLTDDGRLAARGEHGEICIRGTAVTLGYYKQPEKTAECFTQNPLNLLYPELIYRTGDIGYQNDAGELMFVSRKDYQIKHMGHRIELGEIEMVMNRMEGIYSACAVFDKEKKKIVLFYTGEQEKAEAVKYLRSKLPRYMLPHVVIPLETMPLTANGKINRLELMRIYSEK